MPKATTPPDLTITPCDRRVGRGRAIRRWWLNDDPYATAFYNALSVTFPKGEHKGVAYDTWRHATRAWSRGRRWWIESLVMLLTTRRFFTRRARGMAELLRQDGITGPRAWARMAWCAFDNPGHGTQGCGRVGDLFPARFSPVEAR